MFRRLPLEIIMLIVDELGGSDVAALMEAVDGLAQVIPIPTLGRRGVKVFDLVVKHNYLKACRVLLGRWASDNYCTSWFSDNILRQAARYGHLDMVKLLLDRVVGLDGRVTLKDAICSAVFNNHLEVARLLLHNGADIYSQSDRAAPRILFLAVPFENYELLKLLIDYKADVKLRTRTGQTLLHALACRDTFYEESFKLILDSGIDINATDNDGLTALHLAAKHGNLKIARLLIDRGAQIHQKCNRRITALEFAAMSGHIKAVRKNLLDGSADSKGQNYDSEVYFWTYHSPTPGAETVFTEIIRLLVGLGADVTGVPYVPYEVFRRESAKDGAHSSSLLVLKRHLSIPPKSKDNSAPLTNNNNGVKI
ncbi:Nuclear factor NF-kappa-B p105 subunit [Myotisia sp. PD_48]|nr:Nuclear factor NF-kappa-B p105 subunit [Myotisia sp. PD_48]